MNEQPSGETKKHQSGWKKRAIWTALVIVVGVGGFIWLAMPPAEPSYQGKSLSYWLVRCAKVASFDGSTDKTYLECSNAVHQIGTNAIPSLLRMLKAKDSSLKIKLMELADRQDAIHFPWSGAYEQNRKAELGFRLLGDLASNAIPALLDIYAHPSSDYSKTIANSTLARLYPAPSIAKALWMPPTERTDWFMEAGMVKSQSGAYSNAILAYSEVINLEPTNVPAYLSRAGAKLDLRDFPGALSDIGKIMELSPSNETAFSLRGLCQYGLKDFKAAEADFTTAVNLETNDARLYYYRSLARANLRKLSDAVEDCNAAIKLLPEAAEYYRTRAMVEAMQMEYEPALADATKAVALDDHEALSFATRGRIYSALKDYDTAIADYNQALELAPQDASVYATRGLDRVFLNDFANATRDLEKALQLDPKLVMAYMARGVMKAKRGEENAAVLADFQHALELAPQLPETYGFLGLFQYKAAQLAPALANFRKALELGGMGDNNDLNSYIWLIRAQSGEQDAANRDLEVYLKSLAASKTNEWSAITARYFTGSLPESDFLVRATTSAKRPSAVKEQVCESLYYAAMKHKIAGDKPGATALFQKCLDTKDDNSIAYMNAVIEMLAAKQ